MTELTEIREAVNRQKHAYHAARTTLDNEATALEDTREKAQDLREAVALAQTVAQAVQAEAHRRVADIVTHALATVFDEPYEFKIKFEQKRGRTEASLTFEREGVEVDPMTAAGGGVVDVAAFALRLSCLLLSRPPLRKLLVLDEPFKYVSAEYRPRVRELVEQLATKLGVQIIMVTHSTEFMIGTVIQL